MKPPHDSCFAVLVAALLLATPACAAAPVAKAKTIAAKTKAKAATVAKVVPEPQPDPVILAGSALAAQSRGETDLALRLAQSAIVADPARTASYDVLGDIYVAANEPDYARHYYTQALSIDPTDATAQKAISALDRSTDTRAANLPSDGSKTGTP